MCIVWKQSHSGGNGVPVLSALMQADLSLPRSHLVAEGTSEPWSAGVTSSGPALGKQGKSTCQYSTASSLVAALQSFGWKPQSRLQCTSWGGNESHNKTEQSSPLWSLDAQHVHRAVTQLTRAGGNLGFSFLRVITRSAVFSFSPVMADAEIYMEGSSTDLGKQVAANHVEVDITKASGPPSPLIPQWPRL